MKQVKEQAKAHLDRGRFFGIQGKYEEAIEEYKRALEFDPNSKQALTNLKFTYYMSGMELYYGIRKND